MRYGLPYKGSKNKIAEWVVANLPGADVFCDLFCGGGAITHAAMMSGKYESFILNDVDGRMPKLFVECSCGKHPLEAHPEWISREEFHRLKNTDVFVAVVWSFGNNGVDYLYGADIEQFKHTYHDAVFRDEPELLALYGYDIKTSHKQDLYERYLEFKQQIRAQRVSNHITSKVEQLQTIERLESVERLQRLQSMERAERLSGLRTDIERIQSFSGEDYRRVKVPKGALMYCDIPYKGTKCGKYNGFNHDDFYAWAEAQENIFISEYWMPNSFVPIASRNKVVLSGADGNSRHAQEKIFVNQQTFERLNDEQKNMFQSNTATQMTLDL